VVWCAKAATWLLVASAALRVVGMVTTRVYAEWLSSVAGSSDLRPVAWVEMLLFFRDALGKLTAVVLLLGAAAFLSWLFFADQLAGELRRRDAAPRNAFVHAGIGVAAYLVPIANLVAPFFHMRRLAEESDPSDLPELGKPAMAAAPGYRTPARVRAMPADEHPRPPITGWWAAWVTAWLLRGVSAWNVVRHREEVAPWMAPLPWTGIVEDLAWVSAGLLCAQVVARVTGMEVERARRVAKARKRARRGRW